MTARAERRIKNVFAAAATLTLLLGGIDASGAETSARPLITIPPAKLPATTIGAASAAKAAEQASPAMPATPTRTADSATGTMLAVLASSAAFDPKPAVQLVLADESERHAQALFTATVRGVPVIGVAAAELAGATVPYDNADAFAASFPRLRQALARRDFDIGMSDNSVSDADGACEYRADAGWRPIITAVASTGEAPVDNALAQSLADQLSGDTGRPWRIVPTAGLR